MKYILRFKVLATKKTHALLNLEVNATPKLTRHSFLIVRQTKSLGDKMK